MSLRKQCNEHTPIDRFANDYLAFLQAETGYTGWMPQAKVLECDEREWADVFRLYVRISGNQKATMGKSRSHWLETADAYSIPAIVRYPTGELRRSTETERLGKLVKAGVPTDLASLVARFDGVIFLRRSKFQKESPRGSVLAKLPTVAHQCATMMERIARAGQISPSPRPGKNVPVNPRLYDEFVKRIGAGEFAKRYLQPYRNTQE